MPHRQVVELCPRCAGQLVDRGRLRTCSRCEGQWVGLAELQDMAAQMLSPPSEVRLALAADPRRGAACPSCQRPMTPWRMHRVPIERCASHGVWFERGGLEAVLQSVVTPHCSEVAQWLARRPVKRSWRTSGFAADLIVGLVEAMFEALFDLL